MCFEMLVVSILLQSLFSLSTEGADIVGTARQWSDLLLYYVFLCFFEYFVQLLMGCPSQFSKQAESAHLPRINGWLDSLTKYAPEDNVCRRSM